MRTSAECGEASDIMQTNKKEDKPTSKMDIKTSENRQRIIILFK